MSSVETVVHNRIMLLFRVFHLRLPKRIKKRQLKGCDAVNNFSKNCQIRSFHSVKINVYGICFPNQHYSLFSSTNQTIHFPLCGHFFHYVLWSLSLPPLLKLKADDIRDYFIYSNNSALILAWVFWNLSINKTKFFNINFTVSGGEAREFSLVLFSIFVNICFLPNMIYFGLF